MVKLASLLSQTIGALMLQMRDALQKEQPFVDDRLALVGHSAGGLVIRGLITLPDYGYTPRATSRC